MYRLILFLFAFTLSTWSFAQTNFSAEELQADAKLLWQALNELHPGLYRHSDTLTLTKSYQQLLKDFSVEKNEEEAFLGLTKFAAKVKCGHTFVSPFNQRNKIIPNVLKQKVLLPFTFILVDKKMLITQALSEEIQTKDIVTHINGVKVQNIIDSLSTFVKADGNRDNKRVKDLEVHMVSKYEYFDYLFPMVFGWKDRLTIQLNNGSEKTISLFNKEERGAAFAKQNSKVNSTNYDDLWTYRMEDDYAYLQLGTFVTWKLTFDWKEYLDRFFDNLTAKQVQHLIIDIRGNEGGLTDANKYLIKKIARQNGMTVFRKPHLAYRKVSADLRPHLNTWSRWFNNTTLWTKKLNATHRTIKFSANRAKKIKKNTNAFLGQTYLLIDESNSSATFLLAELCKQNAYATLVGTPTGGTKKGITGGQIFFLTLPNTKIEIDIPLIGVYPKENLADEGIQPDVLVEQSLEGLINAKDEPFEKVLDLIKGK